MTIYYPLFIYKNSFLFLSKYSIKFNPNKFCSFSKGESLPEFIISLNFSIALSKGF